MCVTPITLPNGDQVACRNCKRCRDNRVKDWVGRCIAESRTAVAANAVTLTYAPIEENGRKIDRHERTAVLTYSDVQLYLKRLRTAGYPVRYLICGEYGKSKGRAHWHGLLFWQEKVPPHEIRQNFDEPHWPHGFSFWDEPNPQAVKYVCKYVQKDQGDEAAQGKLAMSKNPALGGLYFRQLAKRYVENGVAPQEPLYRFPECKKKDGKPVEFYMSGVTADQFREAYVLAYYEKYPGRHLPNSEFVEEWLDRQVPEWRIPEKLAKMEVTARARQLLKQSEERKRFVEEYNRYYFGKNMRGFWDTEWRPEDEEEQTQQDIGYIEQLYQEFAARDAAQREADFRAYVGKGYPQGGWLSHSSPESEAARGYPDGIDGGKQLPREPGAASASAERRTSSTAAHRGANLHTVDGGQDALKKRG